MSAQLRDRGLQAVRRVRSAREQDSRIGLQHALAESARRTAEAERLRDLALSAGGFGAGSAAEFHEHVRRGAGLVDAAHRATESADTATRVAEEAGRRWQQDRTLVRVVDLLLERRAAERAAERTRREAAELDDLAAIGWLRRTASTEGEPS